MVKVREMNRGRMMWHVRWHRGGFLGDFWEGGGGGMGWDGIHTLSQEMGEIGGLIMHEVGERGGGGSLVRSGHV